VQRTVAARGEGMDELMAALDAHLRWLDASGERERRRLARAGAEIRAIVLERVRARLDEARGAHGLSELAARVLDGELDPYRAADQLAADILPR
jgi:LAO/AO transport system kinase